MEVSYRKQLYMPVTMEVHPVNDALYGKMEQWAPESEKMQAELEGNRLSKTLNVSPMQYFPAYREAPKNVKILQVNV